ncbi:MAG: Gfo/Idh/MocA family oxidoreductase, partial [Lachnospiraceae bacterium]|nr:Gfo/Idh/MocA family oxidoreductase [Lachnospiraceae bacterium]
VTSEDFDKARGKINVSQTLSERMDAVKALGIADLVIVEEYEGQKIDDIKRYHADVFAIGSDWTGKFDYLREYCEVVYLDRTEGISSSELRARDRLVLGLVGASTNVDKVEREAGFVNGLEIGGTCTSAEEYGAFLDRVDAVYIYAHPAKHYELIKEALLRGRHVLCESPLTLKKAEYEELTALAASQGLVLMEALKTAFSTAYGRLVLLLKSGKIGEIVSVSAVCTQLEDLKGLSKEDLENRWDSLSDWGPTGMLPVFQLLGTDYEEKRILSRVHENDPGFDTFSRIDFVYPNAAATVLAAKDVKSEGELVVAGTKGYAYVPAPWWKTDFFEIRYENPAENQRYFYQLEGEGIRNMLAVFFQAAVHGVRYQTIEGRVTAAIAGVMEDARAGKDRRILGERG